MNVDEYVKNRQNTPAEEFQKHAGKYVAWSPDGSKIIASNAEPLKVIEALKALGLDPKECVLSFIPAVDAIVLGVQGRDCHVFGFPAIKRFHRSAVRTCATDRSGMYSSQVRRDRTL